MPFAGGQYAVTATATNLRTALGAQVSADVIHVRQCTIKNAAGALNPAFVGGSGVTNVPANARDEISAGTRITLGTGDAAPLKIDDIYVVGTANAANILFISLVT